MCKDPEDDDLSGTGEETEECEEWIDRYGGIDD
jgi:hypothetical protein